jgi:hypothetical protein
MNIVPIDDPMVPIYHIVATGGTVLDMVNGYRIHMFTEPGTSTFQVFSGGQVEVLVVAGGGGGGYDRAGGGGAGGLIYNQHFSVVVDRITVTVGDGGAGRTSYGANGVNGTDSVFGSLTAFGGGGGGTYGVGTSGGSGGGSHGQFSGAGSGTAGQGNAGGTGVNNNSGGGGGAGSAGGSGGFGTNPAGSGNGGAGLSYLISGTSTYYAGGGGGSIAFDSYTGTSNGAKGGVGGGGNAGQTRGANGSPGTPNTGGGGGGGANIPQGSGGKGGSGIVIVRYRLAPFIAPPSTTISINNVATTLGVTTKSIGSLRGFGGSVPSGATDAISMSQCQKIQHGVGFYNSWFVPISVIEQGTWADTSITNNSSFTYAIWVASISLEPWRNLLNINTTAADGGRRPSLWIYANSTGFHVRHDTSAANNAGVDQTTTTGRMVMNGSAYHVVVTQNGTNMRVYVNGNLSDNITLSSAPVNANPGDIVASPGAGITGTGNYALNKLWFFPYPMTADQVSTYYSSLVGSIGASPLSTPIYSMSFPFTFTNMDAVGFAGPNSIIYAANTFGTGNAYLSLGSGNTAGMQRWTVPQTDFYTIIIAGAGRNYTRTLSSADQFNVNYSAFGAVGTILVQLTAGHILRILVGQQGIQGVFGQAGYLYARSGGCGGTFIYNETLQQLLAVAGGGGGNAGDVGGLDSTGSGTVADPYTNGAGKGDNGKTTTDGSVGRSSQAGTAGTGGGGGGANTQGFGGQGGAGYSGDGLINTANGNTSFAANSFLNGGFGGFGGNSQGGFGGGGNGGTTGGAGAGGGGGYSGGGGGANLGHGAGGGGGGSYTITPWKSISTTNLGMGYVIIERLNSLNPLNPYVPVVDTLNTHNIYTFSQSGSLIVSQTVGYIGTITWTHSTLPTGMTIQSSSNYQIEFIIASGTIIATQPFTVTATSASTPSRPVPVTFSLTASTVLTLTNMNSTGRIGPTSITYGTNTPGYGTANVLTLTSGIQFWTVPITGNYSITIAGAGGGPGSIATGKGAVITVTLSLTQGHIIKILVGQIGLSAMSGCGIRKGGGGGGTFIYNNTTSIILAVAGGGGGGSGGPIVTAGVINASLTTSGNKGDGSTGGAGGTSGGGGGGGAPACTEGGGGGGGLNGNGTNGMNSGNSGTSFINGGVGGGNSSEGISDGGFGGGGAGGNHAGGGGGGYSGGGGGTLQTCTCGDTQTGGGGGSYAAVAFTSSSVTNTGHGYVTVTKI